MVICGSCREADDCYPRIGNNRVLQGAEDNQH